MDINDDMGLYDPMHGEGGQGQTPPPFHGAQPEAQGFSIDPGAESEDAKGQMPAILYTQTILRQHGIEASVHECVGFEKWMVDVAWKKYQDYLMARREEAQLELDNIAVSLPNGTKGQLYDASITIPASEIISDVRLSGFEAASLQATPSPYDERTICITGIPDVAGTFDITLSCSYKGDLGGGPVKRKVQLNINNNPRDLWNNIPTPADVKYYKPDTDSLYVQVPDTDGRHKDIAAASSRGRSHAHKGTPRDDHFRVEYDNASEWYVLAVADGAGSAEFSREGSRITCDTVVEYCREKLAVGANAEFESLIRDFNAEQEDGARAALHKSISTALYGILCQASFKAFKNINDEAAKEGVPPKTYATTLMLAICKKFEFGWFVATFWVGDGAVCLYKQGEFAKLMGQPDEGEFSGQTRFITMQEIWNPASLYQRLRFCIEKDFTALMLMTDGVSDPMFGTDANLKNSAKWDELWHTLQAGFPADGIQGVNFGPDTDSQAQLLGWLDFWKPGEHDDRTIAILY